MTPTIAAILAALTVLPGAGADAMDPSAWLADVARSVESATYRATCSGPWGEADETVCRPVWPQGQEAELAALLITTGYFESRFLHRIAAGQCRADECDAVRLRDGRVWHRARGPWQLQDTGALPAGLWRAARGVREVPLHKSAYGAAVVLGKARGQCSGTLEGTIAGYGTGYTCRWRGAKARAAVARRILAELQREPVLR